MTKMTNLLRSVWRSGDGSALIEGAIIVPALCMLVFGVFEFSWLFYQQHVISIGVRDAARYLARTSDPTNSALQTDAKKLAVTGSTSGTQSRLQGWSTANVTVSVAAVANPVAGVNLRLVGSGGTNRTVTVSTTFTDQALGFFGIFGVSAPSITVSHTERAIVESP